MERAYAHKLNAQELGYRHGQPGGAGRYIYISKHYVDFFPPLSDSIKNDHLIIDVVPPESNDIVLTNFVYHNDKIVENKPNGRDEFRLYLNEGNDPNRDYYKPDDIVLIKQIPKNGNFFYKIYKFKPEENKQDYDKIDNLIEKYGALNHASIPINELSFLSFEDISNIDYSQERVLPDEVRKSAFDEPIIGQERAEIETEITRRVRNASFRDLVLLFYDYKCAITGNNFLIEYGVLSNLEAAHIVAFGSKGGDNPANGLPLIRDLHWAFDNGFFTIKLDYKILVHPKVKHLTFLKQIDGNQVNLPEDSRAWPNANALEWHNEKVFGQFIRK